MSHYVLSIDVKRVDTGGASTANTRDITDELHIVRKTDTLPVAVEYAIHVLTMERNQGAQNDESEAERHDKAAQLFPKVRQALYELGPRGITSAQVDEAACDLLSLTTGVALSVENGRVVP